MEQKDFYEVNGCTDFIPIKFIGEHKYMTNTLNVELTETGNRTFVPTIYKFRKPPEPEKVVVPKFVANWYEENKDNFEYNVQCLCVHNCEPLREIDTWFDSDDTKPVETLVMMHKFGYEIEKEKLYTEDFTKPNKCLTMALESIQGLYNEKRIEDRENAERLIDSYKYAIELLTKEEVE